MLFSRRSSQSTRHSKTVLTNGKTYDPFLGILRILFQVANCKEELVSMPGIKQHKTWQGMLQRHVKLITLNMTVNSTVLNSLQDSTQDWT